MKSNDQVAQPTITGKYLRYLLFSDPKGVEDQALRAELEQRFPYDFGNLPHTVPLPIYLEMVKLIWERLYPGYSQAEAYELMGYYASLHGYFQGPIGQVLKLTARLVGPEQSAVQFVKALKSVLPTGRHDMLEHSSKHALYRMSGLEFPPALVRGWLKTGVEVAGGKLKSIMVTEAAPDDVTYRIELE